LVLAAAGIVALAASGARAATCTATGFYKDSINLTAALIATGDVTGRTIDSTGCNIGIFYGPGTSGKVDKVDVSNANYFGILVAGDIVDSSGNDGSPGATSVDIINSNIHDIGETPFNGDQHGNAIYYYAFAAGSSATGTVSRSDVFNYQKGGIIVNGPGSSVSISDDTVTGLGPVDIIAANGIQFGFGASGKAMRNTVTGNSYTGENNASSTGILVFGGCGYALTTGIQIVKNTIGSTTPADGNDIGVALANYDPTCSTAPSTATNNKVVNNTITNYETTNVSGDGYPNPYQAGISACGNNDKLIHNAISGIGYDPGSGTGFFAIDTDGCSTAAKIHANSTP